LGRAKEDTESVLGKSVVPYFGIRDVVPPEAVMPLVKNDQEDEDQDRYARRLSTASATSRIGRQPSKCESTQDD